MALFQWWGLFVILLYLYCKYFHIHYIEKYCFSNRVFTFFSSSSDDGLHRMLKYAVITDIAAYGTRI